MQILTLATHESCLEQALEFKIFAESCPNRSPDRELARREMERWLNQAADLRTSTSLKGR